MSKLKAKLAAFMQGRYGPDRLYYYSIVGVIVLWILRAIFQVLHLRIFAELFNLVGLALLVFATYRVFSKNIYKRREENRRFSSFIGKVGGDKDIFKNRIKERKTHVYRKCPHCKATLRLPRDRGTHTVRCPKCSERFSLTIK